MPGGGLGVLAVARPRRAVAGAAGRGRMVRRGPGGTSERRLMTPGLSCLPRAARCASAAPLGTVCERAVSARGLRHTCWSLHQFKPCAPGWGNWLAEEEQGDPGEPEQRARCKDGAGWRPGGTCRRPDGTRATSAVAARIAPAERSDRLWRRRQGGSAAAGRHKGPQLSGGSSESVSSQFMRLCAPPARPKPLTYAPGTPSSSSRGVNDTHGQLRVADSLWTRLGPLRRLAGASTACSGCPPRWCRASWTAWTACR